MRSQRLALVGIASAVALSFTMTTGAPAAQGGRGHVQQLWRNSQGTPPAWAQQSIDQGKNALQSKGRNQADFVALSAKEDDLGQRHVRFAQTYQGIPVFGGQSITHTDLAGNLLSESGTAFSGINLSIKPGLSAGQAIAQARKELGYTGQFAEQPSAALVVLPLDNGQFALTYQVSLKVEDGTDATAHHEYFIDANSGAVAFYYDSLPHEFEAKPQLVAATGTGKSLYSGTVSIGTDLVSGVYNMRDTTRGNMYTTDMKNRTSGNGTTFTDSDNTWGNSTNSDRASAGVDAHFGAAQTWDYYLNTFNRRGINGAGFTVLSRVHYGRNYNNAFWNGSNMTYGDGDGATFTSLVSLDVAGHEITHGVTTNEANLTYNKESGALNESFSDIFGTMVEYYTGNVGGRTPDYFIGEDIYVPASTDPGFRNMKDPLEDGDPDNYSIRNYQGTCSPSSNNDNCGVHSNSGIQNNAFYLLAEGGTNRTSGLSVTGITRAKAGAIFYRALTIYLGPSSNFAAARAACLQSAADLYGANSAEYSATAAAWTAVGVN